MTPLVEAPRWARHALAFVVFSLLSAFPAAVPAAEEPLTAPPAASPAPARQESPAAADSPAPAAPTAAAPTLEAVEKFATPAPAPASPQRPALTRAELTALPPIPVTKALHVAWYEPTKMEEQTPWNASVLGSFDPWSRSWMGLLATAERLTWTAPGFSDTPNAATGATTSPAPMSFSKEKVTATLVGGRWESARWAIAYASGTARFAWEAGGVLSNRTLEAPIQMVTLTRGFGATALVDFDGPDIRLGIAWPAIYMRGSWFKTTQPGSGVAYLSGASVAMGISAIGLRLTVGDSVFVEARAGDVFTFTDVREVHTSPSSPWASSAKDGAFGWGYALNPSLRAGLAL